MPFRNTTTTGTTVVDQLTEALDGSPLAVGYTALLVSCLCFGFMFAPLRGHDARDGMFVQWVQCSVVFVCGWAINVVRGLPPVNMVAAIGGVLYATGNVASVPLVSEMGSGLAMLLWGSVQIIVGWCVARFGLLGTRAQVVHTEWLNYAGLVLTLASGVMFLVGYGRENSGPRQKVMPRRSIESSNGEENEEDKARPEVHLRAASSFPWSDDPLGASGSGGGGGYGAAGPTSLPWSADPAAQPSNQPLSSISPAKGRRLTARKIFFMLLALFLGVLHGLMMTPIVYVQDNDPAHSDNVLDYVFSHFSAVFLCSTVYFFLYTLVRRGSPFVRSELVLPAFAYGLLWSVAMTLFIVANRLLSQTVSFPIAVRLPAIIGALGDVCLFRTVKGGRRIAFLGLAVLIGAAGVILVGLSL